MKIRNGFVSNSSSSSFIVSFDKVPQNPNELCSLLFPDGRKEYHSPYNDDWWSVEQVTSIVWEDLVGQVCLTKKDIADEFRGGHFSGYPKFPAVNWNNKKRSQEVWDKYQKEVKEICAKKAEEFLASCSGKVFRFVYNDDTSLGSAMEHGNLFAHINHRSISNH